MDDKEERKRIRRERVRRRLEKAPQEVIPLATVSDQDNDNNVAFKRNKSDTQILESLEFLIKQKEESLDNVTSLRVAVINSENERRIRDHLSSEQRHQTKQSLEKYSKNSINGLQLSFRSMIEYDNNSDLLKDIMNARDTYNKTTGEMEDIISQLKKQLMHKDEEYLANLRRQSEVISQIESLTEKTRLTLQSNYHNQLASIQESFFDGRRNRIKDQIKALDDFMGVKGRRLQQSLEGVVSRREEMQRILNRNQDKTMQVYTGLKASLYTQVYRLERDLSISKAMYDTNSDQIEYNQRAIAEKNLESEETVKIRKKKIVMYKETLSKELCHSKETDIIQSKRNEILHQDCSRLEGQYNNLLSKLHRFEIVEGQKYSAAAAMYQEEIKRLIMKIAIAKNKVAHDFNASNNVSSYTETVQLDEDTTNVTSRNALDIFLQQYLSTGENKKLSSTIWKELESMFIQYHSLLEERERLLSHVHLLKKQNCDLTNKLGGMLKEDINNDLIVAPIL